MEALPCPSNGGVHRDSCFVYWFSAFHADDPGKLIPSQWADFNFWGISGRDWPQGVIDFIASAKYRPDLIRLGLVLQSAMGILSAWFVFRLYYLYRINVGYVHKSSGAIERKPEPKERVTLYVNN